MKCHLPNNNNNEIKSTMRISQSNLNYLIEKVNRFKEGEIVYLTDLNKYVIYHNCQWEDLSDFQVKGENNITMSNYDLNKQIISQLPIQDDLTQSKNVIEKFINDNAHSNNFMLLCKDISYYTIFRKTDNFNAHYATSGDAVLNCANDVGDIIAVDYMDSTNTVEIWIRTYNNQDNICMVLFDCEDFIVTFKE